MRDPISVRLGPKISLLKCLQYEKALEFPYYKKCSGNNLSIDLIISNSHDPFSYTLSMIIMKKENECQKVLRCFNGAKSKELNCLGSTTEKLNWL